jgi:hypothetical protein
MTSKFMCVFPDLTEGRSAEQITAELTANIKIAEERLQELPLERQQELRKVIAQANELLANLQAE